MNTRPMLPTGATASALPAFVATSERAAALAGTASSPAAEGDGGGFAAELTRRTQASTGRGRAGESAGRLPWPAGTVDPALAGAAGPSLSTVAGGAVGLDSRQAMPGRAGQGAAAGSDTAAGEAPGSSLRSTSTGLLPPPGPTGTPWRLTDRGERPPPSPPATASALPDHAGASANTTDVATASAQGLPGRSWRVADRTEWPTRPVDSPTSADDRAMAATTGEAAVGSAASDAQSPASPGAAAVPDPTSLAAWVAAWTPPAPATPAAAPVSGGTPSMGWPSAASTSATPTAIAAAASATASASASSSTMGSGSAPASPATDRPTPQGVRSELALPSGTSPSTSNGLRPGVEEGGNGHPVAPTVLPGQDTRAASGPVTVASSVDIAATRGPGERSAAPGKNEPDRPRTEAQDPPAWAATTMPPAQAAPPAPPADAVAPAGAPTEANNAPPAALANPPPVGASVPLALASASPTGRGAPGADRVSSAPAAPGRGPRAEPAPAPTAAPGPGTSGLPAAQPADRAGPWAEDLSQAAGATGGGVESMPASASGREAPAGPERGPASFSGWLEGAVQAASQVQTGGGVAAPAMRQDSPVVNLPTPVTAPEFREALGVQVSVLARDGVQQAELHLNPGDMGPISVRIELDGQLAQVSFGVDNATTRAIVEAGLPELASALREAGLTLTGGGVSDQARGPGSEAAAGGGSRDGSPPRERPGSGPGGPPDEAHDAPPPQPRRVRLPGGVDLYA